MASDGKWYRPEQHPNYFPPPPSTAAFNDLPTEEQRQRGSGVTVVIRFLIALGALLILGGLYVWHNGSYNYSICSKVNADLGPGTVSCSATAGRVGFFVFLSGIGVLVMALLVRIAEVWA